MRIAVMTLLLLGLFPEASRGEPVTIRSLTVQEKVNGTIIRVQTDSPLDTDRITAWVSKSGWFYVTVMDAAIDTTDPFPSLRTGLVYDFQAHQLPEQVQLNFRLTDTIETFEIDSSPGGREVIITLRSPLDRSLTGIERLKPFTSGEVGEKAPKATDKNRVRSLAGNVLIVSGGALAAAGFIKPSGAIFFLGSGLLAAGYVLKSADGNSDPGTPGEPLRK